MIKTVYDTQDELLQAIVSLYGPVEADITYGRGNFYKSIPKPLFMSDVASEGILRADSRYLPLKLDSIKSVMFDPPFVCGHTKRGKTGIIRERFGYFKYISELWEFYNHTMVEVVRVLKDGGFLYFKCQDTVQDHKNYFSHVEIMNLAVKAGFYPRDLFVLVAKHRLPRQHLKAQEHARKYHSYFWVFEKRKSRVIYSFMGGF